MMLIFCAGAGRRNMQVARSLGWLPGARSDETISDVHRPLYLLDVHWTRYDWPAYLAVAARERPALAVVPDTCSVGDLPRTLAQAEDLAAHVTEAVLVVPKCSGLIERLPRRIGGRQIRLAYSVPTRYGGIPDVRSFDQMPAYGGQDLAPILDALARGEADRLTVQDSGRAALTSRLRKYARGRGMELQIRRGPGCVCARVVQS
jgi:hypothetical protein